MPKGFPTRGLHLHQSTDVNFPNEPGIGQRVELRQMVRERGDRAQNYHLTTAAHSALGFEKNSPPRKRLKTGLDVGEDADDDMDENVATGDADTQLNDWNMDAAEEMEADDQTQPGQSEMYEQAELNEYPGFVFTANQASKIVYIRESQATNTFDRRPTI